jgi:hypothetical protein
VRLAIAGAIAGVASAFFLRKIMASLLFGLSANDPIVMSNCPLSHGGRGRDGLLAAGTTRHKDRSNDRPSL